METIEKNDSATESDSNVEDEEQSSDTDVGEEDRVI